MKRRLVTAALITGLSVSLSARAGKLQNIPVQVYYNSYSNITTAEGSLVDTATSDDDYTNIGCTVINYVQRNSAYVACYAYDSDREYASCYKSSPSAGVVASVSSINRLSKIKFNYTGKSGECNNIFITNSSLHW